MPALSDKLKSLGVSLGLPPTQAAALRPTRDNIPLDSILRGHTILTSHGPAYLIENDYLDYTHGALKLSLPGKLSNLSAWAREPLLPEIDPHAIAFLDTETTGLSGGTGTLAFLIGIGRFIGDTFHLVQYFLPDPGEESGQLDAVEQFLAPCEALVTFNGKSFDIPLLNTRYTMQGWRTPYSGYAHVDLLHLSRRLWRDRLPSRTLANLEVQILGAARTDEDIPGWIIPQMYHEYLLTGDPGPLQRVIYHNAMDILSLAALFTYVSNILEDPVRTDLEHGSDILALARLFEDLGATTTATHLYLRGLDHEDADTERIPRQVYLDAIHRLASIHKHQDQQAEAIQLWEKAAHSSHLEAHIELAKYYEHHLRNYPAAIEWTESAIRLINSPGYPVFQRRLQLPELQHRLHRLQRKSSRTTADESAS